MNSSPILLYAYTVLLILVAGFLAIGYYFWERHRRFVKHIIPRLQNSVFLEIQVPKENADKEDKQKNEEEKKQLIAVAEQIYTTLAQAGIKKGLFSYSDYISFEIVAAQKKISFYINCSKDLQDLVEKQILAQYPHAQIEKVKGYNPFSKGHFQSTAELALQKKYVYPLRTYKAMESDPI